jgi:hypothetical protein
MKRLNKLIEKLRREPWFQALSKVFYTPVVQGLLLHWITSLSDKT